MGTNANIHILYPDLKFNKSQLYFTDAEYKLIAKDFWHQHPDKLTDIDRAYIQAALFIAIDKSEQAGWLFTIFRSFLSAAPQQSVVKLVKSLATNGAQVAFKKYIDDTPKYSAIGRAGIQYGWGSEWKIRCSIGDDSYLTNFLVK